MSIIFPVIETFSPAIPLISYLVYKPKKAKWLFILLSYSILYIILIGYANYLKLMFYHNILFYFITSLISFISFALIVEFFLLSRRFTTINYLIIILTLFFSFANVLWWEGMRFYNSNSAAIINFILIIYCLVYYKEQLSKPQNIFIDKQPSFWVTSAIFIYAAGNFFLFAFYHQLSTMENWKFAENLWILPDVLILIMNIFFAKGIQCTSKQ